MTIKDITSHYPKLQEKVELVEDRVEKHDWQILQHDNRLRDLDMWRDWALKIVLGAMLVGILALLGLKNL